MVLVWMLVLPGYLLAIAAPAVASTPDAGDFYTMMLAGNPGSALDTLAEIAFEQGHWAPAPGDVLVFDPGMPAVVRGEVRMADFLPLECRDEKLRRMLEVCMVGVSSHESEVRFGPALFSNRAEDGQTVPRPAFDDLLSTFIEETGHSWQEYLYETEGRGSGERVIRIGWESVQYYAHGFEYQVKRYILSLDGGWLALSDSEREWLYTDICDADGYANPVGRPVPAYGPPPDWPNPAGWPTTSPTAEELSQFCDGWA
jgi:hypothetical protein